MAEMFGEPDVDALLSRVAPEQFMEWQMEFALRADEMKLQGEVDRVRGRMGQHTGG